MKPKVYMVCGFASIALLAAVVGIYGSWKPVNGGEAAFPTARKLLNTSNTDRVGSGGEGCSKDSIILNQSQTPPLPSGIPTYTVYIENVCLLAEGCSISDIHLSCGWFSTARTINPTVFRRLGYNDCLVNDGKPLNPGESISFAYADTFAYPLAVSSLICT
ncbi:tapetum determinant protein [Perilla frutescens var. hirtella]|nr:tapetum determinant protein [Perilla frutescens var. frutescens]KAH6787749.1 tapetum determinant protein [Perilla frutescens var. hirtella]